MKNWYVYMVRCADNSLYTGIARDVIRRIDEHNNSNQLGSKYTRARRPVTLIYEETLDSRSDATRREMEIKQLKKHEKELLVGRSWKNYEQFLAFISLQ